MIRILDIKSCFEQLNYPKYHNTKLLFENKDELFSENSGVWELEIKEGKCIASKKTSDDVESSKILALTIQQLSQLLVGHSEITKLLEHKNIDLPDEWKDKHLFQEVHLD